MFLRVSVQVTVADFGGPTLPAVANIVIATGVSHCPYGVALHRLDRSGRGVMEAH